MKTQEQNLLLSYFLLSLPWARWWTYAPSFNLPRRSSGAANCVQGTQLDQTRTGILFSTDEKQILKLHRITYTDSNSRHNLTEIIDWPLENDYLYTTLLLFLEVLIFEWKSFSKMINIFLFPLAFWAWPTLFISFLTKKNFIYLVVPWHLIFDFLLSVV